MPEPQTPWRDDGVTIAACAAFGSAFDRRGRGRFCSPACRQAAWRRRQAGVSESTPRQLSGGRSRRLRRAIHTGCDDGESP